MSLKTLAKRFVGLCNQGKNFDVMRTMYAPGIISVEGDGKETAGQGPVIKKLGIVGLSVLAWMGAQEQASGQLFENLEAFGSRLEVGPSGPGGPRSGPKGIATGDLNGDGKPDLATSNLDGSVTVYLNAGGGKFHAPSHLHGGSGTLRGIIVADFDGDGRADIAAAAPLAAPIAGGRLVVFRNVGNGTFEPELQLFPAWPGARNLAAGDFNGDGRMDLALAGPGLGVREYRGSAEAGFVVATDLTGLDAGTLEFPKPVYSLKVVRPGGATRDELVVTHAFSNTIWFLAAGASGVLEVQASLDIPSTVPEEGPGIYSLDVGAIAGPITGGAAGGRFDLITAHRDLGVVQVRRGVEGPARFEAAVLQEFPIPGGPRDVSIVDLDGDGWNDLVVVVRNLDRVLTYHNENGRLVPATEMPVGRSPREAAVADFNLDGHPDVAVINRVSSDVSILSGYPGQVGFGALDQFYLVDGEVSGLTVTDWNGDGRDDVIQSHRASSDVSVRLASPDGSLGPPKFHTVGRLPADMTVTDVNNDGFKDVVTANLGVSGVERGSISVRLGNAEGGLEPERRYELPPEVGGSLFGIEAGDFNADGLLDIAVGFLDCRIGFFQGAGDGTFTQTQVQLLIYEPRAMEVGDFDKDGDLDLAGASYTGEIIVVENRGDILTSPALSMRKYPAGPEKFGTTAMVAMDLNQDGDLDLVVGSGSGAMVYHGGPGMDFILSATTLPGTGSIVASSVATADFDVDGDLDVAVACQVLSCVIMLTQSGDGKLLPSLSIDVPAGRLIATGDLDGDRKPDLVGTGEVLWTALSSRRAQPSGPPVLQEARQLVSGPVLNEILAANTEFPIEADGGRTSDWVEIFNGAPDPVSLVGWRIVLEEKEKRPREYRFPQAPGSILRAGSHLLIFFNGDFAGEFQADFKLPREGAKLLLVKPTGETADEIQYPPQEENVAYGRYKDGLAAFAASPYPSPGRPNADNGSVEPKIKLRSTLPAIPVPHAPIRFFATGRDDVGIVSMSVRYRRSDSPAGDFQRAILYDDGIHEDEGLQDGLFSGVLEPGLPSGAQILFYLEAVDLSENLVTAPEDSSSTDDDEGSNELYSLAVGLQLPLIELSELVASNQEGLRDEAGRTEDWAEVRNCGGAPLSLDGLFLGEHFPATEDWFVFPAGLTLGAGEAVVIFCDGDPGDGPLHAPFKLDAAGGRLVLAGSGPNGTHALIDSVDYGPQKTDRALARSGCGGEWREAPPTPGQRTLPGGMVVRGDVDENGVLNITDPVAILGYLFAGKPLSCLLAAEVTGDDKLDITDPIYLLNYLFLGGPALRGEGVDCR